MGKRDLVPNLPQAASIGHSARAPATRVRHVDGTAERVVEPVGKEREWRARLAEVVGSASPAFLEATLQQLLAATKLPGQAAACSISMTAALELIASLEPENAAQGALAVHVASLHVASLSLLARMHGVSERNMIVFATAAAKLERSFHSSLETYRRQKGGPNQTVRVEKVTIEAGAQALIGSVSTRAAKEASRQVVSPI